MRVSVDDWSDHKARSSKLYAQQPRDENMREYSDGETMAMLNRASKQVISLRYQLVEATKEIERLNHKLESLGDPEMVKFVTARDIVKAVCKAYGVTSKDLLSSRRQKYINVPRQHAMYLCKVHTDLSLPQIGRELGNRDHTTVLHGIARHRWRRKAGIKLPIIEGLDG